MHRYHMFIPEKDPFEKFLTRMIILAALTAIALISLVILDVSGVF